MAVLVSVEDAQRIDGDRDERRKRGLAALDRLDEFRERMAREHPDTRGGPDAVALVRQDRSRDDLDVQPDTLEPELRGSSR